VTRKLVAWLNLAWFFGRHVTTRWWLRPLRPGRDLARFNRAIAAEGYVPLEPATRDNFTRYMACVHCGLCALPCDQLQNHPHSAWDEPWTFVGGAARSLDQSRLIAIDLPACAQQPGIDAICPMGVPINQMSGAILRMAQS
jgi:succinate dehydrogenase/fumarate reductase-like Fe-S protein